MSNLLSLTNCILGLIVFALELWCYFKMAGSDRWVKFLFGLIGLYWAGIYCFLLFSGFKDPGWFRETYIRPAITITLATMASGAIWRLRSLIGGGRE